MSDDSTTVGGVDTDPADYDDRGVPQNAAAAAHLTPQAMMTALTNVLASIDSLEPEDMAELPLALDGTIETTSHQGYIVFLEFTQHLGVSIDVAKIERKRWTSFAGLAAVILEAYARAGIGAEAA